MTLNKKTKKAGALLATATIVMLVFAGMMSIGLFTKTVHVARATDPPAFPPEHLFVDATYLLKTDETNDSVNITGNLYLTNIWEKESGTIKVIAYVIEKTNQFAVFKNTVEIGIIKANSTAEIEIPLVLENSSYRVEVLIFENDKLVIKGKLGISAYPVYRWEEIEHDDGEIKIGQVLEGWNVVNMDMDYQQVRP